jgi:hypothetical protein
VAEMVPGSADRDMTLGPEGGGQYRNASRKNATRVHDGEIAARPAQPQPLHCRGSILALAVVGDRGCGAIARDRADPGNERSGASRRTDTDVRRVGARESENGAVIHGIDPSSAGSYRRGNDEGSSRRP